MSQINVTIPDDILEALQMTPATFGNEVLLAAAVKLYEIGRLSSGAAAQLAGVPRTLLLMKLAEYGAVTFRQSEAELRREAGNE